MYNNVLYFNISANIKK